MKTRKTQILLAMVAGLIITVLLSCSKSADVKPKTIPPPPPSKTVYYLREVDSAGISVFIPGPDKDSCWYHIAYTFGNTAEGASFNSNITNGAGEFSTNNACDPLSSITKGGSWQYDNGTLTAGAGTNLPIDGKLTWNGDGSFTVQDIGVGAPITYTYAQKQ